MANTRKELIKGIEDFLDSEDRCMLITGTHQYQKHIVAMAVLDKCYKNAKILFRTNAIQNVTNREFLGRFIHKRPKAGEIFRIGNNIYEVDSFNSSNTWYKTSNEFDFAIVYPIDAMTRQDVSLQGIDDLFKYKKIGKVFLVSWTDRSDDYSIYNQYVDRQSIFDAEEEDLEYHKRVLETRMK